MAKRGWWNALVVVVALVVVAGVSALAVRRIGPTDTAPSAVTVSPSAPANPTAALSPPPTVTPTATVSPRATSQPLATENRTVTQNRLYRVGRIPASRCAEPAARPTTVAKVRAYYAQFLACLNKAWAPVVRKAGFEFRPAQLQVYSGTPTSVCNISDNATYCAGTIYMNAAKDIKNFRDSNPLWARTTMAFLIAHEYGHHVQHLTGILASSHTRQNYTNGIDAQLIESRRRELQASCLSGVYLGADRQFFPAEGSWLEKWRWTVRNRGDAWNPKRTHGSPRNHGRWSRRGFDNPSPAACNTFTAAASAVA